MLKLLFLLAIAFLFASVVAGQEPLGLELDERLSPSLRRADVAALQQQLGAPERVAAGFSGERRAEVAEDWRWVMSINLDGVFLGVKFGVGAMKQKGGSIINLSSIEGLIGDPNLAAYDASKGGVRLLTKSAALHCARAGYKIRVNSVHPGYIWTPMVEGYVAGNSDPKAARAALDALHPLGHIGEPDDILPSLILASSSPTIW